MSPHSPQNLQAAVAILLAALAAIVAFALTGLDPDGIARRAEVVSLCAFTALVSALGAIGLWRLSYPASDDAWSDDENDDLEHDFTRVRFTGSTRPDVPRDHLRVVSREDADDD